MCIRDRYYYSLKCSSIWILHRPLFIDLMWFEMEGMAWGYRDGLGIAFINKTQGRIFNQIFSLLSLIWFVVEEMRRTLAVFGLGGGWSWWSSERSEVAGCWALSSVELFVASLSRSLDSGHCLPSILLAAYWGDLLLVLLAFYLWSELQNARICPKLFFCFILSLYLWAAP